MQLSQIRTGWETSYLHDDDLCRVGRPCDADHLRRCQGVESSVDDLRTGRGVVLGRAVPMLRSVETQPLTGGFVLMAGRTPPGEKKKKYKILTLSSSLHLEFENSLKNSSLIFMPLKRGFWT